MEVCGRLARCGGGGWRKVTGRNLHAEAGSGEGVGGGCQREKRGQQEGNRRSFFPRKGVTFWVTKRKKEVARTTGVARVGSQAGATAEMTIQSQDTAEDCTAASGELG